MKRLFTLITLLAAMLSSATSWAADYQIWVGGVQVTDANMSNISPAGKTTGTIQLSGSTLMFDGVTMTSDQDCIRIMQEGITVRFTGTNNLTTTGNQNVIFATKQFTMTSNSNDPATVNLVNSTTSSDGYCGIYANFEGDMNIWNLYLNITATHSAIVGNMSLTTRIYTSCSEVYAKGGDDAAIRRIQSWNMSDNGILTDGCEFSGTSNSVIDESGNEAREVRLKNGLYVGRAMVRTVATSPWNVKPAGMTAGTITYANKVLTLDNVKMDLTSQYLIQNRNVKDLKIVVKGSNTLTTTVMGMPLYANTTIEGESATYSDNWLSVTGGESYPGIKCYDSDLTLKNVNLWVSAQRPIEGEVDHSITIDHSGGVLTGKGDESIQRALAGFSNCELLNNSDFPASYYDLSKRSLIDKNGDVVKSILYASYTEEYPIEILGHRLNDVNAPLGFVCEGVKGSIIYSKSDKKLTLEDVTIEGDANYGIYTSLKDLTVELTGENEITNTGDGIYVAAPATFIGEGSLGVTSTTGSGLSIYDNTKVSINVNNVVTFTGEEYGYWGHHDDSDRPNCDLVLTKAGSRSDYYFNGKKASIYQASHLECNDMDFFYSSTYGTPGCYFDETDKYVKQNGGEIVKESDVNFYQIQETYPISICGIMLNNCNCRAVGSPYIKSGPLSVSYDTEAKALTLDNVEMVNDNPESTSHAITFYSDFDGKIMLIGDNSIIDPHYSAVVNEGEAKTVFAGDGSLYVQGAQYALMPWKGSMVFADNVKIEAKGEAHGIGANNNGTDGETLIVRDNAMVKASSIGGLNTITLEGEQSILEPAGAEIVQLTNGWAVCVDGEVAKNVVIAKTITYGLSITDKVVTSTNCNDILGDGKFKYDDATKTLTINGDCSFDDWVVASEIDGLTINVAGPSTLTQTSNGSSIIRLFANATITGGKLTLTSTTEGKNAIGIYISKGDLLIKDADIDIIGDFNYGITGESICMLTVDNSNITATAHEYGACVDWGGITLTNCYVETPRPSQILSNGIADGEGNIVGSGEASETVVIKAGVDAINGIEATETSPAEIYDVAGRKLDQTRRGINIVRSKDGKAVKVIKK